MLKRFNIIYLMAILAIVALWNINLQYREAAVIFYGFAENKETEINLEHPIQVDQIFVTTGQRVDKNMPLLEVSHNKLPLTLNKIIYDKEEIKVDRLIWEADIQTSIDKLEAKKAVKVSEINGQIAQIEAKVSQNRSLVKGLSNVEDNKENSSLVTTAKINGLKEELKMAVLPLDVEIERLKNKLKGKNNPFKVKMDKLNAEQTFYEDKGRKLSIFAPSDGLIGNIHCKEAENISAFKTLITFYEENPTLVEGYVHEKLLVHVKVGDTLTVSSSLHSKYECKGIVTGLGSRIIEIPERLRKYKSIASYGREVLIKIPSNNEFLQKEKVMLKLDSEVDMPSNFFEILFKAPTASSSKKSNQLIVE